MWIAAVALAVGACGGGGSDPGADNIVPPTVTTGLAAAPSGAEGLGALGMVAGVADLPPGWHKRSSSGTNINECFTQKLPAGVAGVASGPVLTDTKSASLVGIGIVYPDAAGAQGALAALNAGGPLNADFGACLRQDQAGNPFNVSDTALKRDTLTGLGERAIRSRGTVRADAKAPVTGYVDAVFALKGRAIAGIIIGHQGAAPDTAFERQVVTAELGRVPA